MRVLSTLIVGATAFATYCAAQSSVLGFTRVPTSVTAGQATVIEYTAEDENDPVTITLRKGDADNLDTIQTLTSTATGGNYTWIPLDSFEDAEDYALQIQQGREINYSGAIALSGSDPAAVSAAQAVTASLSSVGAAITSSFAQSASIASIQSIIASYNSSLANLTSPVTSSASLTGASASGTGINVPRNTTMVSPTLTATATATETETDASSTDASSTDGSGQGSATDSAPAASSSGAAAKAVSAISGASPLALVLCMFAGMLL